MSSRAPESKLIQVVPRLLPGRCGVSDQAVLLARELKTEFGIDSTFVVLNSNEQTTVPYATVYCPAADLLENCLKLTQGRTGAMLLHVSGYGYSRDGAPILLADALEKMRAIAQFRMAAYFHETFASGPPWKSAFWYTRRQKRALRRIAAQCGLIVTNIGRHAEWLERTSRALGSLPVERMPVFSPAGETDAPVPFAERNPVMVMFGLRGTRERGYRQLVGTGNRVRTLGIQEILDVGPDCDHPPSVNGIRVKRVGMLAAEELSALFSQAQFGFVPHDWFCLAKSSVFAGYCAQGTIPVLAEAFAGEADGLRDGVHMVTLQTAAMESSARQTCSRAAWNWYMGHRLHVHAERYAKWVGESA
jgi:hypothetical protein